METEIQQESPVLSNEKLIRLSSIFIEKAAALAREGLLSGKPDTVSISVNLNKAKELSDKLIAGLK